MTPRIPGCCYRLQLNKNFNFRDATALVDYLDALGVTDVYASPFLVARPGSMHGYDVIDHARLNPEIGTDGDLDALAAALKQRGMGLIMDVVPNHMCIASSGNHWWNDVLENGRSSPYAAFFDIDWHPPKTELHEKVLLPVLGEQYGRVLENQESQVDYEAGAFHMAYWSARYPDRAAHHPAAAGTDRRRPAPQPSARSPRRPRDREHRHRHDSPADPLGHRARQGARAHARERDRQAAARCAGLRQRRRARRSGAQPGGDQRREGQPAQLRPAGSAARRSGVPPELLGRRRRGDQLPPLLRHQRSRRHTRRAAQRAGRRSRQGVPAAARRQGDRPARRPRRRSDGSRPATSSGCSAPAPPRSDGQRPARRTGERIAPADLRRRREDPGRRRGAAARVARARHHRLRVPEHGQRPVRRRGRGARHRAPVPAPARGTRGVRRSVLPREAPDPAHRDVERALRARPPPRSDLGAAPLVARLHPEQPAPGAGRGDRLLPRLPHLRAGDLAPTSAPAIASTSCARSATPSAATVRPASRCSTSSPTCCCCAIPTACPTPIAPSGASSCCACSSSPGR